MGQRAPEHQGNLEISDSADAVETRMYGEDDRSKLWGKEWRGCKSEVSKGRNVHITMSS